MQVIVIILLYVVVASILMVVYFNRLTAQQRKEIKEITAQNRMRITRQLSVGKKDKEQKAPQPELAHAM